MQYIALGHISMHCDSLNCTETHRSVLIRNRIYLDALNSTETQLNALRCNRVHWDASECTETPHTALRCIRVHRDTPECIECTTLDRDVREVSHEEKTYQDAAFTDEGVKFGTSTDGLQSMVCDLTPRYIHHAQVRTTFTVTQHNHCMLSVWPSPRRQTPGPSCLYLSDRPPSGHHPGRRQARHAHILQIGHRPLNFTINFTNIGNRRL